MRILTSLVIIILAPCVLCADIVRLKSGGRVEGRITHRDEESIVVQTGSSSSMTIKLSEVESIEEKPYEIEQQAEAPAARRMSPAEVYNERLKTMNQSSAVEHFEMAEFSYGAGFYPQAIHHYNKAKELDAAYADEATKKLSAISAKLAEMKKQEEERKKAESARKATPPPPASIVDVEGTLKRISYAKGKDPAALRREILTLALDKGREASEALAKLLDSSDAQTRFYAAEALSISPTPFCMPSALKGLKDKDAGMRLFNVRILGRLCSDEALGPLLERLKDTDSSVRHETVMALGCYKQKQADIVNSIVPLLEDGDKSVRSEALRFVAEAGDESAVKPLIKLLSDEGVYEEARVEIIRTLGLLKSKEAVKPLAARFKKEYMRGRTEIAVALGQIGGNEAADALSFLFQSETERQVLSSIFDAIVASQPDGESRKQAVAVLVSALGHKDDAVRTRAVTALGKFGDTGAREKLRLMLGDSSDSVRRAALEALK